MKETSTNKETAGSKAHESLLPLLFEMGRLLKREMASEGVAMPSFLHLETLRFIQEQEAKSELPMMSDVADYLKITAPSATALVTLFVKEGIINRIADPEDRRRIRLGLSQKGTDLLNDIMQKRAQVFGRVMNSLSEEDCRELARILTIITRPQ